jgi:hypothetical protein
LPSDHTLVLDFVLAVYLVSYSLLAQHVRITQDRKLKCLEIDQSGYLKGVLEHFGMADANPHNMLLLAGAEEHLIKFDGQTSTSDIKHYQSLIGSLMYLEIGTRPDISFAVARLAQYAANPSHNISDLRNMFWLT